LSTFVALDVSKVYRRHLLLTIQWLPLLLPPPPPLLLSLLVLLRLRLRRRHRRLLPFPML
jgi:hypothetical protein